MTFPRMTQSSATLQKAAGLRKMPLSSMGSSLRRTMMSGETPRPWSSFTECWVGFVFVLAGGAR